MSDALWPGASHSQKEMSEQDVFLIVSVYFFFSVQLTNIFCGKDRVIQADLNNN